MNMDVNAPAGTRYTVTHRTQYAYGATMADGYSVAYLLTRATPSQRVLSSVISTEPRVDEYDEWPDVFGNRMVQLGVHQPHTDFVVEAVSEVVTYRQERPRANQPWERVARTGRGLARPARVGDVGVRRGIALRHRRRTSRRPRAAGGASRSGPVVRSSMPSRGSARRSSSRSGSIRASPT